MPGMSGVLIIDKPAEWTSHDVVARVRKLTNQRRVGHTGTLDPFATGVLVVLLGRATRLAQFLSGAEKEYEAVIRLGYATDTGDTTGAPIEHDQQASKTTTKINHAQIEAALETLRGEIDQIPPMYSAKKIGGRKLYDLARRGETVEREAVRVSVKQFSPLSDLSHNHDGTVDLRAQVVCSAGTYVRVLAEDLGKQLGTGGHLAALRRTRAGQFTIEQAVTPDQLAQEDPEGLLISPDLALRHLPAIDLSAAELHRVAHGMNIPLREGTPMSEWMRLRDPNGMLIAVGRCDTVNAVIHPQVVIGSE